MTKDIETITELDSEMDPTAHSCLNILHEDPSINISSHSKEMMRGRGSLLQSTPSPANYITN
jgi:hypothetical protein